jgi:hypothetical protein
MPPSPSPPKSRFDAWDEKLNVLLKRFFFFFTPAGIFLDKEKRNWRSLFIWYYATFAVLLLFIWKNPTFLGYLSEYFGFSFSLSDFWLVFSFAVSPLALYSGYHIGTRLIEIQKDAAFQKPLVANLIQCVLLMLYAFLLVPGFAMVFLFFQQILLVDYWVVASFGWSLIAEFVMLFLVFWYIAQLFNFKGRFFSAFFFYCQNHPDCFFRFFGYCLSYGYYPNRYRLGLVYTKADSFPSLLTQDQRLIWVFWLSELYARDCCYWRIWNRKNDCCKNVP